MTARKKEDVQRTKSNLISSPSTDTLVKNLVAINSNQFENAITDVVLALDTQETISFLLDDPL